jgi:hypothetical protein
VQKLRFDSRHFSIITLRLSVSADGRQGKVEKTESEVVQQPFDFDSDGGGGGDSA